MPRTAEYTIQVDWANDGSYDGPYDDVTPDTLGSTGVTVERGRDQQRASGDVMVPAATWTLNNEAGTYSPQRGPLSSNLLPGRRVTIAASVGGGGGGTMDSATITMDDPTVVMQPTSDIVGAGLSASLFAGSLDELTTSPSLGSRTVQIRALGSLVALRGRVISTELYQTITTGAAMVVLLEAAGLTEDDYVIDQDAIDSGRTLAWWWVDAQDAYDAAVQLLESEGPPGALYEDGQGRVVFESRLYRSSETRSTESQATFRDDAEPGGLYYQTISYEPGLRDIINDVSLTVDVRTATASPVAVWEYGATLTLDGSGAGSIVAQPNEPFLDAIAPVWDTDFSGTCGSGTVVALSQTSGKSTVLTFSGGVPSGTVTGLKLRATSVPVAARVLVRNTQTSAVTSSRATYGTRSVSPSVIATLSLADAQLLAEALIDAYAESRPLTTITFANADEDHLIQALTREVSDRIHIVNDSLGVDDDYSIEQISHEIGAGALHTVRLALERAPSVANVGRWQESETGVCVWSNDAGTTPNAGVWG